MKALVRQNKNAGEILGSEWNGKYCSSAPQFASSFVSELGIEQVNGCFFLKSKHVQPHGPGGFFDETAWECFMNKIHVEDYLEVSSPSTLSPKLCFLSALNLVNMLSEQLQSIPGMRFHIFASLSDEFAVVNFYRLRDGQSYLLDDLEGYMDEAIVLLLLET